MLDTQELGVLSRTLLHALRHAPDQYYLEIDADGWTSIDHLVLALRYARPEWSPLEVQDLRRIEGQAADRRFEIRGGRIRALYGHSVANVNPSENGKPPATLYHGTTADTLILIRANGIRPMGRRFVHWTANLRYALEVAAAKGGQSALLGITTNGATARGVIFRQANDHVWLTDAIAPQFLTILRSQPNGRGPSGAA
jgi:putative RNA 2'-phosphotransferase